MSRFEKHAGSRARVVDDLAQMIRIPSVNPFGDTAPAGGAEVGMATYFEDALDRIGLEVDSREVSAGRRNVWGVLKGTGKGPTVLLAGHLDTVGVESYDAPFEPRVDAGRMHGRGSCDMKAGLAAYLEVARRLIETGTRLRGDLIIAGVVDEEHAMTGSVDFGQNGPRVDCAIVAEPTGLAICPAHKGQILTTIRTRGLSAHSSMPERGRNAVYHMAAVVQALQGYADDVAARAPDPMCGAPSFSVGVIRGGDNACSVPDLCEIDVDRRTIPGEAHAAVRREIETVLHEVAARVPGMAVEIAPPFLDLPPLETAQSTPVMRAMIDACMSVTGKSDIRAFPGSTDAPNYRCPTVICGPGNLEQCHSLNEYVSLDEIESAVVIYLNAIAAMQAA